MDAARLLDEAFRGKRWQPQMVCLSGNTDCYQPVERKLQLTRQCLEVFLKYRNPIGIITKNFLVARDIDILRQLAKLDLVQVTISVTTLDKELARRMEPRTSTPDKRLEAIELLASNNIPVDVNVAPIIPGLNDEEIPSILQEVAKKGARSAWYTMVRLPGGVKQLFIDWLEREMKDRARKILGRIRDSHGGELEDTRWGIRFRGEGEIAKAVKSLFQISCDKNGLNKNTFSFNTTHFRIPTDNQLRMFG
jgi:DNA repair photolyase